MFGLANLYLRNNSISDAEELMNEISFVDSSSQKFILLQRTFENVKGQNELETSNKILEDARLFSYRKEYNSAIKSFNQYLNENPNDNAVKLELANVHIANSNLDKSIKIYDDLLKSTDDYEIEKQRAKVYLWNSDSSLALKEFRRINQKIQTILRLNYCSEMPTCKMVKFKMQKSLMRIFSLNLLIPIYLKHG